ncbi:MAG: HelD family protein [Pseudomonadales bacterium]
MVTTGEEAITVRSREQAHLEQVRARLNRAIAEFSRRLRDYATEIQEQKNYLWSSRDEMDHIEKIAQRQSIEQAVNSGDFVLAQRQRLQKLLASAYFGRVDVVHSADDSPQPVYLGIHHFRDDADGENVIYDWRAPIASLFYDYETGPARYQAPQGEVCCEVRLKRQFRIEHGSIELMIDSAVNMVDDVLRDELSRTSDESMRNIVATIQRDQNAIIRNDAARELIIQGVAGSGKTSIALHRIAYLLYRFKDTLSSEDILIVSPNRVFAKYIANVLPELGEETINEIGMEQVADELLEGSYRFQTFFEQTTALLERGDEAMKRRLRFKASPDFLRQLQRYADHVENSRFAAEDVWVAKRLVPAWLLDEIFRKHRGMPTTERLAQLARETEQKIGIQYNYDLLPEQRKMLKEALQGMLRQRTLRDTYKGFYDWIGQPELFKSAGRLEYADVFPLIYLKMQLEGLRSPYRKVKHLLVDEMQDYTPVQYAVLARLFSCNKTILGDARQAVNPYNSSSLDDIRRVFGQAYCVNLNRSYRSTWEITRFAQRISPNPDLEIIERHGPEPKVLRCQSRQKELEAVRALVGELLDAGHQTVGVICKTTKQAAKLMEALEGHVTGLHLLREDARVFGTGVSVCTAHLAKGLEFDAVVVPGVDESTYSTEMDRNLLYVACTRAKHELALTHAGPVSLLLESS